MIDITAVGEILIDLTQSGHNELGIPVFAANPGGAPANLAVAAARLGASTAFIGKVGTDSFGTFLRNTLIDNKVDVSGMITDPVSRTTLAVVALDKTGERTFSFYRDPSADVNLRCDEISLDQLKNTKFLHFGSGSSVATGKKAIVTNPRDTQVLNLRQQPSLDAKVLHYYRNGAVVTILETGKEWHKVQTADGRIGYMMAQYLTVTGETAPVQPMQAKLINVNGGSYVNFRKGASLNSSVIARLPVGSKITVTEHGTDWCKVIVDGVEGYVSTWFMTF